MRLTRLIHLRFLRRRHRIENALVDEAPSPRLARLERAHHRMLGCVEVFRRMLVLRAVATTDVSAGEAQTQMNPGVAHREAFLATIGLGLDLTELAYVTAIRGHSRMLREAPMRLGLSVAPGRPKPLTCPLGGSERSERGGRYPTVRIRAAPDIAARGPRSPRRLQDACADGR